MGSQLRIESQRRMVMGPDSVRWATIRQEWKPAGGNLGSSKPRFDGLGPAARDACLEDARRKLDALSPDDFVRRGVVVYPVASMQ